MDSEEKSLSLELNADIFDIFKEFMAGVAEFDELTAIGGKLLSSFQQGLGILLRPPIDDTSELIKRSKAKESKRVQSYFESGCVITHNSVQNTTKCRIVLNQLESLLDSANNVLQTELEDVSPVIDRTKKEVTMEDKEELALSDKMQKATDFALLMAFIYQMVEQDFAMQEKIISDLNLKSPTEGLESYSLMWSLRPFVNDGIMERAWKLIR